MVERILVDESVAAGDVLTSRLVDAKFPLVASFWLYTEESGRWRLTLASPLVDQKGPLKAYERIQELIRKDPAVKSLTLSDISVVSPRNELVKGLRVTLGPAASVHGVRLGGTRVDHQFVDAAYLYRLTPLKPPRSSGRPAPAKAKRQPTRKSHATSS